MMLTHVDSWYWTTLNIISIYQYIQFFCITEYPKPEIVAKMINRPRDNANQKKQYMLDETRDLLYQFYAPSMKRLRKILQHTKTKYDETEIENNFRAIRRGSQWLGVIMNLKKLIMTYGFETDAIFIMILGSNSVWRQDLQKGFF